MTEPDSLADLTDEIKSLVRRSLLQLVTAEIEELNRKIANIEKLVDDQVEAILRHRFCGDRIYVRRHNPGHVSARDTDIAADARNGLSVRAIARKHRMSKSQVHAIVVKTRVSGFR